MHHLETKWSVNESLLQSYRSIFISSQSFLMAVGAFSFEKYRLLNILLAIMSLLMIWMIWVPVVRARRRIVDYYKYALKLTDDQQIEFGQITDENGYVRDGNQRSAANRYLEEKLKLAKPISDLRETRLKVDIYLPIGFSLIWFIFLLVGFFPGLIKIILLKF